MSSNEKHKTWTTTLKETPELGTYLEIPPELLEALRWDEHTELRWSETEICSEDGETQGLVLEKATQTSSNKPNLSGTNKNE